jgi:hypothetical protein
MIIWDETDPWGPKKDDRCKMCCGRLRLPVVMWDLDFRTTYFCSECCAQMGRGFSSDLRQMATAKEVRRLGFHHAARRAAVSGGFLYTTGTDNEQ